MADANVVQAGPFVTRAEAKARGLKTYNDGNACKHGHFSDRNVTEGKCLECLMLRVKKRSRTRAELLGVYQVTDAVAKARASGSTKYFTGRPCKRGHVAERYVWNGHCVTCRSEDAAKKHKANPEKARAFYLAHRTEKIEYAKQWKTRKRRERGAPELKPNLAKRAAKKAGVKWYTTGEPCVRGHVADRQVSNGVCRLCARANVKASRQRTYAPKARRPAKPRVYDAPRAKFLKAARLLRMSPEDRARRDAMMKLAQRKHHEANREKIIARVALWVKNNPERHKSNAIAVTSRRRARMLGAPLGARQQVRAFLRWLKTANRAACYWCKKNVPKHLRHADHIIPLSRGGAHAASNLCASCSACNLRKHAKLPEEFAGQAELSFAA